MFILISSISLLFFSCEEVSVTNLKSDSKADNLSNLRLTSNDLETKTLDELYDFKKNHFKKIAASIVLLQKNKTFKQGVYAEIEKRFDGDFNVLIETLQASIDKNSLSKNTDFAKNTKQSSQSFKGLDNIDFYPQLYIPFYQELKKEGKIGVNIPKIILNIRSDENSSYPIILDAKGNIVEDKTSIIDEKYAQNNEVWVISLNERFHGNKDLSKNSRDILVTYSPKVSN